MKGLLLKDCYALLHQRRSLYIIVAILLLYTYMFIETIGVAIGFLTFFALSVMLSLFTVDDQANWVKYALTMPVTRRQMVVARYIITSLAGLVLCAAVVACSVLAAALRGLAYTPAAFGQMALMFCAAYWLVMAITFPVIYIIGVERGRIIGLLISALPMLAVSFLQTWLSGIFPIAPQTAGLVYAIAAPAALLLLALSYPISVRAIRAKDL